MGRPLVLHDWSLDEPLAVAQKVNANSEDSEN